MRRKISVIIIIIGLGFMAFIYQSESERLLAERPTAWFEDHNADCAVVLTGGPGRVREGFDLLSQKMVRKLIISGVYPGSKLREIFPQWPFYGALNEEDVILEKRSRTTFGNAQQSLPLVEALHCRDMILITSRLHMYRSRKIFKSVFPVDFPIYTRAIVTGSYAPQFIDVMLETTKSLFYSLWAY